MFQYCTDMPKSLQFTFWNIILRIKINITSATNDASETNNHTLNFNQTTATTTTTTTSLAFLSCKKEHCLRWMSSKTQRHALWLVGGVPYFVSYKRWTVMANVRRDITYNWVEFIKFNQHIYSTRTVFFKHNLAYCRFQFCQWFVSHLT
jgi:hypothetical protein